MSNHRHERLSYPTWVLQLTNAELIEALGTADDAREHRGDAPVTAYERLGR